MSPINTRLCLSQVSQCVIARKYVVLIGTRSLPCGGWLKSEGEHVVFAHPVGDTRWQDMPGVIAEWIEAQASRRDDGSPVVKAIDIKEVT